MKMYCEICKEEIKVPNAILSAEAIKIHINSHTKMWITDAIDYIKKQKTDESEKLIETLNKIQEEFIKIASESCPHKENTKNGINENVRCGNFV